MIPFRMPSLGADMEFGTVIEWLVKPGDTVERGDIVAVVDTEKAEIEIEIWDSGMVDRLLVPEGEQVPVGAVLAELEGPGGEATVSTPSSAGLREPVAAPVPKRRATPPARGERLRVSPLARRVAEEFGVDLAEVRGTGADGAIKKEDVERVLAEAPVAKGPAPEAMREQEPPSRAASMRRAIAKAMARSNREIPHYYLETTIDFRAAQSWLADENARRSVTQRLLPGALLLKATALALRDVPELNGHFIDGAFRPSDAKHIGMAIALRGGGLLAPAIHDVDQLDLDTLMHALRDLVNRTRRGKLRGSEVSGATMTVTSLGDTGVEKVFGVIYPPQVALVGFGRIAERPWAHNGMIGVVPAVTATLSADHRASDGARGAKFLESLAERLAAPERL